MARTGFLYDDIYLEHRTSIMHPEKPERLKAIISHLEKIGLLEKVIRLAPKEIAQEWLEEIHSTQYINHVREICESGVQFLDSIDTEVCPKSYEIALLAAGGIIEAVSAVEKGEINNAFCAVRPPGHHAVRNAAMGFCLFNNIAVAARFLQKTFNLERILIVDWDVHHGNGTQAAFYDDDSVFYFSTHQFPHYPMTGSKSERGVGKGEGYTLNVPMGYNAGDMEYIHTFKDQLVPTAARFRPDFILVSAGFDFHVTDPYSGIKVTYDGVQRISDIVVQLAEEHCTGKIVSILEGGYSLDALAKCVEIHLLTLLNA